MSRYHEMQIDLFTKPLQKKQTQDTIIKFIKTLVKFISENHTDKITCTGLVADEPHEIQQYRKSLSNWTTQQKNLINLKRYI